MAEGPRIKPHLRVHVIPGEGVFFVSTSGATVLSGKHIEAVVPLLDGCRTEDDIADLLAAEVAPPEVFFAIEELRKAGFVTDAAPALPLQEAAFWHMAGVDPAEAITGIAGLSAAVTAIGAVSADRVSASLVRLGISVETDGDVDVIVADDYLRPELEAVNARALATRRPWLLMRPVGRDIRVGPVFIPGETACWKCLEERMRGQRQVEDFLLRTGLPFDAPPAVALDATLSLAADLAALELQKWRAGVSGSITGKVLSYDMLTGQGKTHVVVRRPQCPACGDSSPRFSDPPVLEKREAGFREGGLRSETASETLRRLEHHVSAVSGLVPSLDPSCRVGGPAHVVLAGHNLALKHIRFGAVERHMRSRSGGKGKTAEQARAGALCEALERYSSQFQGCEYTVRGRLADIENAIHPNACMLFSDRQYEHRETTNRIFGDFHHVPAPFPADEPIEWAPLWSFTHRTFRFLPAAYVYFHTPALPDAPGVLSCFPDSNGNASGNSLEEALLQGMLEVVERDAVALWWYNRIPRRGIDIGSFGDRYYDEISRYYHSLGREVWALDLTADSGIPVIAAVSRSTRGEREKILFGFGCHPDPAIALDRAVTEMNQFLPKALADDREQLDPDTRRWFAEAQLDNQPYLVPRGPSAGIFDFPALPSTDLLDNVEHCRRKLESLGLDVMMIDLSRPDVGLSVVKVVVPGMRHFWRRLAPGRLYDVPQAMGWRNGPLGEDDVNPYPMFV